MKHLKLIGILASLIYLTTFGSALAADIDTQTINRVVVDSAVKDLVVSADGKRFFALNVAGEVEVFNIQGDKVGNIVVGKDVTHISAQGQNLLLLTRKGKSEVEYLVLSVVEKINTKGAAVRGNKGAPVQVVIFDDFQCPYCARLAPVISQVLDKYPEKVSLVLKNFPLPMHSQAEAAAIAALAAQEQGKYWEYHDLLFENYNKLNPQKFDDLGKQIGLDMKKFAADRKNPAHKARVQRDKQEGQKLGVRGTPTVFINGRKFEGERSLKGFSQQIEAELHR